MSPMEEDKEFNALTAEFGKDLEQLANKWMQARGKTPTPADQMRIAVAGFVALGARYGYVKAVVAKLLPRPVLLGLDKTVQKMGKAFLTRPADGQPGLRAVEPATVPDGKATRSGWAWLIATWKRLFA